MIKNGGNINAKYEFTVNGKRFSFKNNIQTFILMKEYTQINVFRCINS